MVQRELNPVSLSSAFWKANSGKDSGTKAEAEGFLSPRVQVFIGVWGALQASLLHPPLATPSWGEGVVASCWVSQPTGICHSGYVPGE